MGSRLGWYWRRLRRMSGPEAAGRLRDLLRRQAERRGLFTATRPRPPELSRAGRAWLGRPGGLEVGAYLEAADRILAGRLSVFALRDAPILAPPRWNRDPLTGREAPLAFGPSLNYRDERLVGDIKYLWEPNRHLHLVSLAQAWALSGREEYLHGLEDQLESWFEQCPYLRGPNWSSALELGLRLINWSAVWHLIGGPDSPLFRSDRGQGLLDRWLASVYQHGHFIRGHFSRYSSANNHLIGEAAGLFVAAVTWPLWPDSARWRDWAFKVLVRETLLQNAPDGVNREQAVAYQHFVLDFLIIAGLAGRANGVEFPERFWSRIETMIEFLASIMDLAGNVPAFGDDDDGYVIRLAPEEDFQPYRSLIASGAVLFRRPDFKAQAGRLDDKSRWLLGPGADSDFAGLPAGESRAPLRRAFPEGGYYVLGADFGSAEEIRLVVDAGPLGYLSIAAHGHADALSFTLSIGGREFLIDPGTYCYHTRKEWRDYFRGTAAHNTLRLDGLDQSVSGGNFMWTEHAAAAGESFEPGERMDRFLGRQDGYQRLNDPVRHRREIRLLKDERKVIVTDSLDCRGRHRVERSWHFSEACCLEAKGQAVEVTNDGLSLEVRPGRPAAGMSVRRGQESPPGGWVSRRFDEKVPAWTLVLEDEINGPVTLVTEITWPAGRPGSGRDISGGAGAGSAER